MASTEWQLAREAAERYQHILTPAILGPFARALVDTATLRAHESVVDVGCGTGAAARYAAERVGSAGQVTGIDVNTGMLEVAQSLPPVAGAPIAWREASATRLPLDDQSVDVVLCAQTLQFLAEKQASLSEMRRVVKPGGRIAVSLWCPIADNPYFDTLVSTIARQIGAKTAAGLGAAFAFSDADEIRHLFEAAGFGSIEMTVTQLDLPLPPLAEFVPRHISATPMATDFAQAGPAVQRAVVEDVAEQLRQYETNGQASIPFRSHIIVCSLCVR
jgi:ubiquinone/menaquinone biosynthesis C-methylase UbiE